MALDDNALVSLELAKQYLNLGDSSYDFILEIIINATSSAFDRITCRQLAYKDYVDILLDGPNDMRLYLPNWPIVSVTSVYEDNVLLTEGSNKDFLIYADEGYLLRLNQNWSKGRKNIKISYSAGYKATGTTITLPKDLQLACLKQVAFEFTKYQKRNWGESSRSFPDGSATFNASDEILPDVMKVLMNYRRII